MGFARRQRSKDKVEISGESKNEVGTTYCYWIAKKIEDCEIT